MEADGTLQKESEAIIQSITRHINGLGDENRATRKRSIEGIRKEVLDGKSDLNPEVLHEILVNISKPVLKLFADPVEKCRELSIRFASEAILQASDSHEFLPVTMPVLVQRLGQKEITEPSEELRLLLVGFMFDLVHLCQKHTAIYIDDFIQVLKRTIVDPYPEVRKESCKCASSIAKTIPQQFHMQSETLINPLLRSLSHQHSKVRVEVIKAIGDVIQYGNGKSVDDVVTHLAQRLFDQAPSVRSAVVAVVGRWLLDLMDRYSFFHKLIPLLLTGLQDEMPDIQSQAEAFWHDVGLKYEGENEQNLKDKQDFVKENLDHYPPKVERPNLGCRELMYGNFSKILSGLVHDLTDWVVPTRIKSSQLLYVMLLSEENNVTQHLDKVLAGLYRACHDDEKEVVKYAVKSAELIGYFVSPEVWSKMVIQAIKMSQSVGSLMVMAAIIRGSRRDLMVARIQGICEVLSDPLVLHVSDTDLQAQLLSCADALSQICREDTSSVSQDLFDILVTVLALSRCEDTQNQAQFCLERLAIAQGLGGRQDLYHRHTKVLINSMKGDFSLWTQHSVERIIFDTLLLESGPVVGEILEDVIPILRANLNPEKDPEVKLKFFGLLSRLVLRAPQTLDSQQQFGDFAVTVVRDMILPNLVWRAGRTAAAVHTSAVSCLWALLESGVLTREKIQEVMEDMMTQLISSLDNDSKQTRLITCRIITRIFIAVGTSLERHRLHNMYPDLLKRLDDSSDDVRVAVTKTFLAYFDCFGDDYEPSLYRAHLEEIYKGLLVHLDDPEARIQDAVLEVLVRSAQLMPAMLAELIEVVRFKHRSTRYLDKLLTAVHALPSS